MPAMACAAPRRLLASSFLRPFLAAAALSSSASSSSCTSPFAAASRPNRSPAATRFTSTMSDQTIIFTKDAPAPVGPYSQAIKTPFAIYCSGAIPLTAAGEFVGSNITTQTTQCCENLKAVLAEAGSSIPKVVKTMIFISDMAHFAEMNTEYEKYFSHKPARSCVAVKTLPKNVDVEIECIALP
ncbi:hypothetical protein NLG97_g9310 [Lecanicillium saksenae]|uniref:Uncharacterized protein n=1 Tax=Lecanicillium saksenae TaxID=468837 RepID=A0ACC1QGL4_9HYPO|nr:hypothetical protein NLG97_g9310 [Lecanicillium saksenae]